MRHHISLGHLGPCHILIAKRLQVLINIVLLEENHCRITNVCQPKHVEIAQRVEEHLSSTILKVGGESPQQQSHKQHHMHALRETKHHYSFAVQLHQPFQILAEHHKVDDVVYCKEEVSEKENWLESRMSLLVKRNLALSWVPFHCQVEHPIQNDEVQNENDVEDSQGHYNSKIELALLM